MNDFLQKLITSDDKNHKKKDVLYLVLVAMLFGVFVWDILSYNGQYMSS